MNIKRSMLALALGAAFASPLGLDGHSYYRRNPTPFRFPAELKPLRKVQFSRPPSRIKKRNWSK